MPERGGAHGHGRRLAADNRGAASVQLALGVPFLLLFTLGIFDFGRVVYDWSSAQKAVQVGVHEAITRDPVFLPILFHFACSAADATNPLDPALFGTPCTAEGGDYLDVNPACDIGAHLCTNANCTGTRFDTATGNLVDYTENFETNYVSRDVFDDVVAAMQGAFPRLEPEQVTIGYRATNLGFVGKPDGPVPEVTVTLSGVPFDFFGMEPLRTVGDWGGLPVEFTMPDVSASMTAEDLSDNTCAEQGLISGTDGCEAPAEGEAVLPRALVCFP